jgi:D-psicose/D-tagatose/L-ribulose 3-epimerase
VKAAAANKSFSNPIGAHALVFSGDWSEAGARKAAAGAAAAGESYLSQRHAHQGIVSQLPNPVRSLKLSAAHFAAGYDLVEIAAFNAASLDAAMTKRVFQEHGLQAACSLGLTLDADISSDSEEVRVSTL